MSLQGARFTGGTPTPSPPPGPAWNPADAHAGYTFSEGNLRASVSGGTKGVRATLSHTTGKWYWEFKQNTADAVAGFATAAQPLDASYGTNTFAGWYQPSSTGWAWSNNAWADFGANTVALGNRGGLAIDLDAGKLWLRRDAGWVGDPAAGTGGYSIANFAALAVFPFVLNSGGTLDLTANFGASAFAHAIPAGFAAWDSP